jgi:hypothetical protein
VSNEMHAFIFPDSKAVLRAVPPCWCYIYSYIP